VREIVTIWYSGAKYQLGRGQHGYGIWAVGGPGPQPLEQWPETPDGWSAAWSRFTALEAPGRIAHLSQPAAPAARPVGAVGAVGGVGGVSGISGVSAVILLAAGVACGVAGLFPGYLSGASLAKEPAELVPHVIYLAVWTVSALLIALGGTRQRVGTLLALGTSVVTFGLFFADAGTVIAGGTRLLGAGLVLGLVGWLACAAGSTLAFRLRSADAPGRLQRHAWGPAGIVTLAALGAAAAFAPSWDSYTLRTSAGLTQSLTAGNSFANPGPVIAGDVAVMVALVAVVVTAALWRPSRLGAALLAGALIPMVAQAISALVQVSEPTSPTAFGVSRAQAAQSGLTISSGLTAAFWLYCAFVVALVMMCGWMLRSVRPAGRAAAPPGSVPAPMPIAPTGPDDSRDLVPDAAGRQDGPAVP
jgi:hypothetical protein